MGNVWRPHLGPHQSLHRSSRCRGWFLTARIINKWWMISFCWAHNIICSVKVSMARKLHLIGLRSFGQLQFILKLSVFAKEGPRIFQARRSFFSPFCWWSHQPTPQFQITNFSVSTHQNVLYSSVAIPDLNILCMVTKLNSIFLWLETDKLVFWKWWFYRWLHQKFVSRMDGAPYWYIVW